MMYMIKKWIKYLYFNIEEIITLIFFAVMSIFVFVQILFRYIVDIPLISLDPIMYSEELARFSYIWIAFIGLSLSTKNKENIKIYFFREKMVVKMKHTFSVLVDLVSLVMLIYLFVWSVICTNFNKILISPALEFSMIVVLISVPIGFALTIIRKTVSLYNDIKKYKSSIN